MLRPQPIIGAEHAKAAQSEAAGDRPVSPRRHPDITAAMQVEQSAKALGASLWLRPFAGHAAKRQRREAHASRRKRRRPVETLAHMERCPPRRKPPFYQSPDREVDELGAQFGHGSGPS